MNRRTFLRSLPLAFIAPLGLISCKEKKSPPIPPTGGVHSSTAERALTYNVQDCTQNPATPIAHVDLTTDQPGYPPSHITNCYLASREGEDGMLFAFYKDSTRVWLDGYAIIPLEKLSDRTFVGRMKANLGKAWFRRKPCLNSYCATKRRA